MGKRDYIEEIDEIKSRAGYKSRYDLTTKLETIESSLKRVLNSSEDHIQELIKYIPVATVACFESYFKHVVKELIDSEIFPVENIQALNKANIKLDFK